MTSSNSQLIKGLDYDIFETLEGKEINFRENFNKRIEYLPDGVTIIIFNDEFDNYIDYLPNGITHIYFGRDFNKPVNDLPYGLKFISFGINFQQPINCLPNSIEEIRLTQYYDQEIKNLPTMLKTFNVCKKPRYKSFYSYYGELEIKEIATNIDGSVSNYDTKYGELEEKYPYVNIYY